MRLFSTCARAQVCVAFILAFGFTAAFAGLAHGQSVVASTDSWSFEETSGVTAVDATGANNGTLVNGVSRVTSGKQGRALSFDGVDDYVTFGDSSTLEAPSFSVAAWVKRNGAQLDWAKILNKGYGGAAPWASYKIEFAGASDDRVYWQVGFTDGTAAAVQNVTPIPDGQWTHVVGVFDGTKLSLYINGKLDASATVAGKTLLFDAVPLTIGGYAGWGYFNGQIDEVGYYNHALSATEVQQIFSPPAPAITLTNPNTGVNWLIGSLQTIAWSHTLGAGTSSMIDISRDGGSTWTALAGPVANGSLTGSYDWIVAGPATTQARVRVTSGGVSDISDVNFTTSSPTITVTSPNTGVNWLIGSLQTITWSHTLGAGTSSMIDISRDGGATWTALAGPVANGSVTGSYDWTVAGPATTQARVRVSSGGVSDISDVNFTTSTPTITVTSPNVSSTTWQTGTNATVTWSGNLGTGENVKIELSQDGGATYPIVLAASTPSDGSETIAVQTAWATPTARARVTWERNTTISDASDASFVIASLKSVTFQSTTAEFLNPERGFYVWTDFSNADYSFVRNGGNTITRQYIRMDAYINSALPTTFLNQLTAAFQKARKAGVKMIPRFSYNFGPSPTAPDASRTTIEQHLQQLAPVLAANEDVIAAVEAGFIGAYGEWHDSTHGLDTSQTDKAAILSDILQAVPASRMVALRYPSDMEILNGPPITSSEAFTGSNRSRVGSHQDCFLASPDDWGTWGRSGNPYDYDKAYIAENGRFAVVGGETCNVNPPRSSCPTALYELQYMHWSYLNLEYEPNVIQGFKTGGCFDEIRRRLGYRLQLESASYSATAQRGTTLLFNFLITNVGYAAMFNARPVFAVLSNSSGRYVAQLSVDPRHWEPGTTTTVSQSIALPSGMAAGTYTLSLWMPDQAASIRNNPSYAVRLADVGTWKAADGTNIVATDVVITP